MGRRSCEGQVALVIVWTVPAMKSSGPQESDLTHGSAEVCQTWARNGLVGNRLGVRHGRSNVRQSLADSGNRRHDRRTTCGESAGQ